MKGISNRQKLIVKPRESVQKYVSQRKDLRMWITPDRGRPSKKGDGRKNKR